MNARWLSLPLTARGLLRELAAIVGADGALDTALAADAPATTIGAEVARLLCAFPHEHTRVKRDVVVLIERGFVIVDASLLRVVGFDEEVPPDADIVRPAKSSDGGSAKRMRELRARRRALANGSSPVTPINVTRDAAIDDGDASSSLSFKKKKVFFEGRESAHDQRHDVTGDAKERPGVRRCVTRDTPFDDRARAIAEKVGVRNAEAVWFGFTAHYAGRTLERDWEDLWQKWGARQITWDQAKNASEEIEVDLDAPWMREAMGGTR